MKRLILAMLLCMSSITYAGETGWYVGAGVGRSNLKYDTNTTINDSIKKQGYVIPLAVLEQRGAPIVFSEDYTSNNSFITVGYRLSQIWSLEAQYGDLGTFKINADFHIRESGVAFPGV